MSENFVQKDIHDMQIKRLDEKIDEKVGRIEQKLDAAVERMELRMEAHMACVDGVIARMEGRMEAMDAKISNISCNVALIMTIFGLIMSGINIYFSRH